MGKVPKDCREQIVTYLFCEVQVYGYDSSRHTDLFTNEWNLNSPQPTDGHV